MKWKTFWILISTALEYSLLLPWYLGVIFHYYLVQYFKPYYLRDVQYGENERNDLNIYYQKHHHDKMRRMNDPIITHSSNNILNNNTSNNNNMLNNSNNNNMLNNNTSNNNHQNTTNTNSKTQVLLFIHGGAWNSGDKLLYHNLGCTLRDYLNDHILVICNYRKYSKKKKDETTIDHSTSSISTATNSISTTSGATSESLSSNSSCRYGTLDHMYDIEDQLQDVEKCIEWIHSTPLFKPPPINGDHHWIDLSICGHSSGAHLSLTSLLRKPSLAQYVNRVILLAGVYDLEKQYQREIERGVEKWSGLYRVMRGDLIKYSPYHMLIRSYNNTKKKNIITSNSGGDRNSSNSSSSGDSSSSSSSRMDPSSKFNNSSDDDGNEKDTTIQSSSHQSSHSQQHSLLHSLFQYNPNIKFHIVNGGQDTTVLPEYGNEFISHMSVINTTSNHSPPPTLTTTTRPSSPPLSPLLFHVKHFENFNHSDFVKLFMGILSNTKECLEKKQELLSYLKYDVLGYQDLKSHHRRQ
ncbi:hypothetical protein FDP41_007225 [Naegleria fowleri]|uniref:Uncharacterized protein n=1 Tax=Naegleria fowleri TaxID=5763 RepID=A0A6A5BIE9_NAEFO|nr:uncharacterized protein FDP41_007225 [Naegleria fowleri]KAF0973838.1 hypothetical protein FDP41_007225 [Naegleria fowleri]